MKSYIFVTTLTPTMSKNNNNVNNNNVYKFHSKVTRLYDSVINRTDVEETVRLLPMGETGTATKKRYIKTNPVYPKGKCFNLISFIMD